MSTWYDYRAAWTRRPWLLILAVVGAVMVLVGVAGSVTGKLAAVLFIPGLLVLLLHHLLANRSA